MVWLVGHERPEQPWCQSATDPTAWRNASGIVLDDKDARNGPRNIDRHDCVAMDANGDNVDDLICAVGADRAVGQGYNELYLTRKKDGTLLKVHTHGLQKYPWSSTRTVTELRHASGRPLVFIGYVGRRRRRCASSRSIREHPTDAGS